VVHPDPTGVGGGLDHGPHEGAELRRPGGAEPAADHGWEHVDGDDAGGHCVLEVVAHVGDPVGPRHDLALRRGRCGSAPRVVADAVDRLGAQVERHERDVGAPHRVIEPLRHVRRQRILGCVTAGAVAAIVADRDGLGERHVETDRPGDRSCDLRDFERVGEARALMVVGEDEHLCLAGQAAERVRVQDAVAVTLEAGAERVGLLVESALAGTERLGGQRSELRVCVGLAGGPRGRGARTRTRPRVFVGEGDTVDVVPAHRGRPARGTLGHGGVGRQRGRFGVEAQLGIHAVHPTRWV
jgi:hypothetical protein